MPKTLAEYFREFAKNEHDFAFVQKRGLRRSRLLYLQVAQIASQFARELEARGVSKGDRVVIWAENSIEWVAAFYGCVLRGAIVVPLDEQSSSPEFISRVFNQVQPKLVLRGQEQTSFDAAVPAILLESLSETVARHGTELYISENIEPDDIAEIIFTSGTTNQPKGVLLTHENILSNLQPIADEAKKYLKWERFVHPIRILSLPPLSHVFGQFMALFIPPLFRAEVHFLNTLNPSHIIETVKRERISVVATVPRVLEILQNKIERDFEMKGELEQFQEKIFRAKNWNALKRWWEFRSIHRRFGLKFWAFVSGGATLDAETEKFWRRLGFVVVQGYGMTETAALVSLNHPFKSDKGSIGEILRGQEVKLDESGEILVRGRNITPGYWGATSSDKGADEWFRTGDLGEMDEEGRLYFKGRKKDVIVTAAGLKVYPEDLEAALNRQPEILSSAVVGIEGAQGPEPVAALIPRFQAEIDLAASVSRANETLAPHQRIRRWVVWPEQDFPRTSTQKVRKQPIVEFVQSNMRGEVSHAETASPLAKMIARIGGEFSGNFNNEMRLSEDLKLDSLARVELMSEIEERYQMDVDEAMFTAATTLGDIERIIRHEAIEKEQPRITYPRWAQKFPATWFRIIFFYLVLWPITLLMSRRRVHGREQIENLKKPLLFVSNHVAAADHAVIMSALPARFQRSLAIAMDGELLESWLHPPKEIPLLARLRHLAMYVLAVSVFNVFPLPQKSGFRQSFAYAGEAVDRGYSLLVFPEGLRTPDGLMHKFQSGIGILATKLDLAVVPVKIAGLYELKAEQRYFARSGEVSVTFGEPVKFERDENAADIAADLEQRVRELA